MPKKKKQTTHFPKLRQKAEDVLKALSDNNGYPVRFSPDDMKTLIHDFQIHRIELEMQNDKLKRSQKELDTSRTRYFDFFNMAPVGFFSVDEQKLILECNLTAATLLERPQSAFIKQPITQFILKEDQDIYYLHSKQVFETKMPQECDLRMLKNDGSALWVHLATIAVCDAGGATVYRIVMSNITERILAEEMLIEQKKLQREITELRKNEEIKQKSENRFQDLTSRLIEARENECKRISMELHDVMGQSLTAVGFNLNLLQEDLPDSARGKMEDTLSLVDYLSDQVQILSFDPRPRMLDELGLIPTLRLFLNKFSKRTGIKIILNATGFYEYRNENLEITIFRIVQEALNNVLKHAKAKNIVISLKRKKTQFAGVIHDDGKGFDLNKTLMKTETKHIGLIYMKERIAMLGGTLDIKSGKTLGTIINIKIPII